MLSFAVSGLEAKDFKPDLDLWEDSVKVKVNGKSEFLFTI